MAIELVGAVSGALAAPQTAARSAQTQAGAPDFTQFLTEAADAGRKALGDAETAAVRGLSGDAPLHVVVGKVMEAERALQTAIALRDRFVASLQEISRMQI